MKHASALQVAQTYSAPKAIEVKCSVQSPHKLTSKRISALLTDPYLAAAGPPIPLPGSGSFAAPSRFVVPWRGRRTLCASSRVRARRSKSVTALRGSGTSIPVSVLGEASSLRARVLYRVAAGSRAVARGPWVLVGVHGESTSALRLGSKPGRQQSAGEGDQGGFFSAPKIEK